MASVRLRSLVPNQLLAQSGWDSELFKSVSTDRYDVVVFQKAYESEDILLAEGLADRGTRIVLDLCDNHFYNPEDLPQLTERADRLSRMVALADAISVSTPTLGQLIENKRVFLVDDALDPVIVARSREPRWPRFRAGTHLAWFGTAGSRSLDFGLVDLARIIPNLNNLNTRVPITLTVISNSREEYRRHVKQANFSTHYCRWKFRTFSSFLASADIALIPITSNPFTICKTSNRIVTSLMLGTPVVADLIPSYREFEPYILVGEWERHLERYARDRELRHHHVTAGRQFVQQRFAPEVIVEQWSRVFHSVLDNRF